MSNNLNRRGFIGQALVLGAAALFGHYATAQERRRGGGSAAGGEKEIDFALLDPKSAPATAVNYVEVHSDFKKNEMKVERQGVKWEAQNCGNCGFFKKVGLKNGKEAGTCQIFPKKLVLEKAWCATWNKKA